MGASSISSCSSSHPAACWCTWEKQQRLSQVLGFQYPHGRLWGDSRRPASSWPCRSHYSHLRSGTEDGVSLSVSPLALIFQTRTYLRCYFDNKGCLVSSLEAHGPQSGDSALLVTAGSGGSCMEKSAQEKAGSAEGHGNTPVLDSGPLQELSWGQVCAEDSHEAQLPSPKLGKVTTINPLAFIH